MNIPHAVGIGIWLSGAASGAVLIWLLRASAERRSQRTFEALLDQALFGGLRQRKPPSIRPSQASPRGPRVLVAEDDDAVRHMLRESLERDGFEVVAVATAKEALGHIATENFDASLSALHIPQTRDGLNIVSAMRHIQPHAVTLVLSSYATPCEALLTAHVQADGVMEKPVQIASLRQILREKLAKSERHRRPAEPSSSTRLFPRKTSLDRRIGSHSHIRRLVN